MVGSGGAGGPYTFSATGLPAGLTMSSTGTISGTPTVNGTFNYTVTVTDKNGNSGTVNCSVTVYPPPTATCVTINAVLPGTHDTDRVRQTAHTRAQTEGTTFEEALRAQGANNPMRVLGDAEDFGAVVAFLCSEGASYVNGAVIRVDGSQIKSIY